MKEESMCSFVMEGSKGGDDLIDLNVNFWLFDWEISGSVQVKKIFFINDSDEAFFVCFTSSTLSLFDVDVRGSVRFDLLLDAISFIYVLYQ